ncbi:MAG: transglycosylase family protein [Actinomycetia bacterium]|nr:transglycosylase family protein [Actinomycetes bacterium]
MSIRASRRATPGFAVAAVAALLIAIGFVPGTAGAAEPSDDPQVSAQDNNTATEKRKAKKWAKQEATKEIRRCQSGNRYNRDNGSGHYGSYGLTSKQWRNYGGRYYAKNAAKATKSQQNLVSWRLYQDQGWDGLACPVADWMDVVYRSAPKTTLSEMLIPGSHDSGSSKIDVKAPCPTKLISAAANLQPLVDANACAVAKLARAQGKNLGKQLTAGNRYLDLRVGVPEAKQLPDSGAPIPPATDPTSVPLVLHHNVVSQKLTKGLEQVQRFARDHPREQVILDFQHTDLTGDSFVQDYYINAFDRLLRKYAPGKNDSICSAAWSSNKISTADNKLGTGVPIKRAWRAQRNLLVLFPDGVMPDRPCYRSRDAALISLWPNTEDPQVSLLDNEGWLQQREAKQAGQDPCLDGQGQWCQLYVSQLQLSIQAGTQAQCIFNPTSGCSLKAYAKPVNNGIADVVTDWRFKDNLPVNIVMLDFANKTNPSVPDAAMRANWKIAAE